MNTTSPLSQQEKEFAQKIESIYHETIVKIKALQQEQKKAIADCIKKLEQEKIEEIKKSIQG